MRKLLGMFALIAMISVPLASASAVVSPCVADPSNPACAISFPFGSTLGASMLQGSFVGLAAYVIYANANGIDFPVCSNTIAPGMNAGYFPVAECQWNYPSSSDLLKPRQGQGD